MKLAHGLHLAYCTNIHRGESWIETIEALRRHTLAVRDRVAPGKWFGIGLRLSALAARELSDPATLADFQRWLERENCYVYTINGFPFGRFHGTRVKEQVYAPDWTHTERVDYTNLLFDLLGQLVPAGVQGSVSTVPVSFKPFNLDDRALAVARANLWKVIAHIESVARRTGRQLHLGLEPEPLCTLETSSEAVAFFERLREDRPTDLRIEEHLGLNYDCCHLAVEYESPAEALGRLRQHRVRLSKVHLSNALRVTPTVETRTALRAFTDQTYLHQVIQRAPDGSLRRFLDLPEALHARDLPEPAGEHEWRIHFHIPLHHQPTALFATTADHVAGTLDWIQSHPAAVSHLEMETYTWEVLPAELKSRSVVDQLADEYAWTLAQLARRSLA